MEDIQNSSPLKSSHINILPDSVLLEIFSKLDYDELCLCSRVCRRWQRITKDFSLKKCIIVKKSLDGHEFLSLIRNHFTNDVEEFQFMNCPIARNLTPIRGGVNLMFHRSCKLKKLVFIACSLFNVSIGHFPLGLQHLSIRESALDLKYLLGSAFNITHLTCLDLGGCCDDITSDVLHVCTKIEFLRALYLEGCYRINNAGIESIQRILPQLEVLDIEGTDISNEGIWMILDNCENIKKLFIGHTSITDSALSISKQNSVPNLSELCVRNTDLSSMVLHTFLLTHVTKKLVIKTDIHCSKCFNDSDCLNVQSDNSSSYVKGEKCNHYLFHKCSWK